MYLFQGHLKRICTTRLLHRVFYKCWLDLDGWRCWFLLYLCWFFYQYSIIYQKSQIFYQFVDVLWVFERHVEFSHYNCRSVFFSVLPALVLCILQLCYLVETHLRLLWTCCGLTLFHHIISYLSLVIFFDLKYILSDIN